jgi:hypothetical protein
VRVAAQPPALPPMADLRWAAVLVCLPAACVGFEPIESATAFRFGAHAGAAYVAVGLDDEDPLVLQPTLLDDWGRSGFVEAGFDQDGSLVLARAFYGESDHVVRGLGTEAEVRQFLVQGLWGPVAFGGETVLLRPLFGVGLGGIRIDYRNDVLLDDETGVAWAVIGGIELQVARRLTVGATGWAGGFGEPGDTEGWFTTGVFYGGVRFQAGAPRASLREVESALRAA